MTQKNKNHLKKRKFYGVYAKSDNFLYGVFPFSTEGLENAQKYIQTKLKTKNNLFYIKKK